MKLRQIAILSEVCSSWIGGWFVFSNKKIVANIVTQFVVQEFLLSCMPLSISCMYRIKWYCLPHQQYVHSCVCCFFTAFFLIGNCRLCSCKVKSRTLHGTLYGMACHWHFARFFIGLVTKTQWAIEFVSFETMHLLWMCSALQVNIPNRIESRWRDFFLMQTVCVY